MRLCGCSAGARVGRGVCDAIAATGGAQASSLHPNIHPPNPVTSGTPIALARDVAGVPVRPEAPPRPPQRRMAIVPFVRRTSALGPSASSRVCGPSHHRLACGS